MIDDAAHWDAIHQKNIKAEEPHSHYAEHAEKEFPRNSLVVDMGSGTGGDALYFLKNGHSVIAVDISEFALKILSERAAKLNLSDKLVTRQLDFGLHLIPVKDDSVNVVYSRISLNYFGAKHTCDIFKDVFRVLKRGGHAFITLKSPDDRREMEYFHKTASIYEPNVFIDGRMLRSRFTIEQLDDILKNTGISRYHIRKFEEDLSRHGVGNMRKLVVNEVTFFKSK